ncbi:hypothetical protein [Streptomyces sp. NPDC020681]|uniref:hypothetical protein n=1 Tax=Streptomyces sp. NPDC020681 TaxID=3365083 RepID=UPI00379C6F66
MRGAGKAAVAGAVLLAGLLAGCGDRGESGRDESWRAPTTPPSLSPPATPSATSTSASPSASASASASVSGTASPSGSATATGPATTPGRPTATGGSGGSGGGHGSGGAGGTGGEPEPPVAPPPPSQEAPAGGTDGFPYDGNLCSSADHGPYLQVLGGSGSGSTAKVTAREGRFSCDGDEPRWKATGGTTTYPLNPQAHITVTTPFVKAGQRKAIGSAEFLSKVNAAAKNRVLVFHYQTDPEQLWIFNQIDPAQY